ncbi:hypothetical protein K7X08_024351 [Anisodus acutangulus]|uniref:Photosynthetic NDH subcomplex B 4 n=1 Tax=Anisodus acutangulus TaxID=402998 RepID=A0A9Q1RFW1_9SOLA|nr:hypothetical protein K7X08_024351 [Anisodus acutangulus]
MAEAMMIVKPKICSSSVQTTKRNLHRFTTSFRQHSGISFGNGRLNALPDWPLMTVLVEHMEGQTDLVTHKSVWHLSTFYIMFTIWGCLKTLICRLFWDPYYDSEQYRGDGGDGTGHWVYEKQEDIEEAARAALWREELIEEIEQKVGGLRELD